MSFNHQLYRVTRWVIGLATVQIQNDGSRNCCTCKVWPNQTRVMNSRNLEAKLLSPNQVQMTNTRNMEIELQVMKAGNQVNQIIPYDIKELCTAVAQNCNQQFVFCYWRLWGRLLLAQDPKTASTWVSCSDSGSWMHCVCGGSYEVEWSSVERKASSLPVLSVVDAQFTI